VDPAPTIAPEAGWRPRPWVAAILGFFFQPLGMLYVCRVRLAILYFSLGIIIGVTETLLRWKTNNAWLQYFSFGWLLMIICSVHAYRIARQRAPVAARPWYSRWYGLSAFPLASFLLIFGFRAFLYEPFRMPSGAMLPSVKIGSTLLTQKWSYGNYRAYGIPLLKTRPSGVIRRGDIIVFEFPASPAIYFAKRVIGLPGDRVRYQGKKLTINGSAIETTRLSAMGDSDVFQETLGDITYRTMNTRNTFSLDLAITVPERSYFVLGDNRDHSNDSRYWGFVPESNIVGKVVRVIE
jgi:signal peptidase I